MKAQQFSGLKEERADGQTDRQIDRLRWGSLFRVRVLPNEIFKIVYQQRMKKK